MDLSESTESASEQSPRWLARRAGICQLLAAVTTTFGGVIVPGKLYVSGDVAGTVDNILKHNNLFWFGFASSIAGILFHAAWALFLCDLLKVANKRVSSFALFVMLVGCSILTLQSFLLISPLVVIQSSSSLSAFTGAQLQTFALIFLRLGGYAFYIFSFLFGVWLVSVAFLIFKSNFLPRFLAVLVAIAGLGWMLYLFPPLAVHLFPFIAAGSAIGEIPLELWLIVMAVDEKKWKQQALDGTGLRSHTTDIPLPVR